MGKPRRTFTREFKVEAVQLVTEQGRSFTEAVANLGIAENLLRKWKKDLDDQGDQAFSGKGNLPALEEELRRLWAENKRRISSRLVVDALERAIRRRLPGEGLRTHWDRGSPYASDPYQRLLERHAIPCSMSRRGNCWDNAPMESSFASLKKELIRHKDNQTRAEARASIFEYIEVFYNRVRRHSALGYLSPVEYEQAA